MVSYIYLIFYFSKTLLYLKKTYKIPTTNKNIIELSIGKLGGGGGGGPGGGANIKLLHNMVTTKINMLCAFNFIGVKINKNYS